MLVVYFHVLEIWITWIMVKMRTFILGPVGFSLSLTAQCFVYS